MSLAILDVLLTNNIVTSVYRKTATNDLYLDWNSFTPTINTLCLLDLLFP